MTTPERLKRRQMIEGLALIILGICTIVITMYFRYQDVQQTECFESYIAADATTGKIRSQLVEDESAATRRVISSALSAGTRQDIIDARTEYEKALQKIDRGRQMHPTETFDPETC